MLQRSTYLILIVLALSACSRQAGLSQDPERSDLWMQQQAIAAEVSQWNLYARGVLRLKGEVYNIAIRWLRYDDQRFMMLLEAPFGQGVLRIEATGPERVLLKLPNGRQFENTSAEALLNEVVGWSLPVSGLDFWIRGLPDPGSASSYRLNSDGRATSIRQKDWDISYTDYFEDDNPVLPRRFSLSNDKLTLKLVIERWQPLELDSTDTDLFPSFN